MRVDRRRVGFVVFAASAVAACLTSVAWACTYSPRILALSAREAPRGSEITMIGQGVVPERAVELRWNAVEGMKLAQTTADRSGDFSAPVRIPDVAPGVYSLVVVADGAGVGRATFEVTSDATSIQATPAVGVSQPAHRSAWPDHVSSGSKTGTSPGLGLGVGLLSLGLVVLSSGGAVALLRRRRAAAGLR